MVKCVYCEKTDTLNTQLTVKLEDDTRITVDICDDHSEEATVKTAREAYQSNQDKIAVVLEQAKALGLNITEGAGGLTIAEKPSEPAPAPVQAMTEQSVMVAQPALVSQPINPKIVSKEEEEEGWIDTGMVDGQQGMQSIGGNVSGHSVTTHASHQVTGQKDVLPQGTRRGKVKMQLVEGRGGQPIAVPAKRVDGTGTTRIKIQQKEDDHKLQRRFKDMATKTRSTFDNAAGPDFRSGYNDTTRTCPICRGNCVINDQDCPKCDGMGFIQVH